MQTDCSHISAVLDKAKMADDWLSVCHEVRHTQHVAGLAATAAARLATFECVVRKFKASAFLPLGCFHVR